MKLKPTYRLRLYALDDNGTPVRMPDSDILIWAERMEGNRVVAQEQIGPYFVSTVFLGLDHNWRRGGSPLLFETMAFCGDALGYQERCSTREEALAQHAEAVATFTGVIKA